MPTPNLHTKQFSQRQVCKLMNFSESTVKSWGRKGFRLVGQGGSGEIKTKRGQGNSLSGFNALELMLTIHLTRQGIDPIKAHEAAVSFSHVGTGSSYGWEGIKRINFDREPGQLYQQQGTGTLVIIAMGDAPRPHTISPLCPSKDQDNYVLFRHKLGITSQHHAGIAIFHIDGHVLAWRRMLNLPLYPNEEEH